MDEGLDSGLGNGSVASSVGDGVASAVSSRDSTLGSAPETPPEQAARPKIPPTSTERCGGVWRKFIVSSFKCSSSEFLTSEPSGIRSSRLRLQRDYRSVMTTYQFSYAL